uniref:S8 family peptidase n=1 Tax=Pseudomonas aeruginosa TaxID=287 RepID=UPI00106CE770
MTDRPLLWFPQPQPASRSKLQSAPGRVSTPSHERQGARVSIKLSQLQEAFEARRAELVRAAAGVDPEQVLVIETVGAVEDFAKAVKKIEGLEWLGEIEVDELPPDEDFHDLKDPEKPLKGRLYLVLTNQQALNELLSLWRHYKDQDDPKLKFDTGLTKFRDVFCHLLDIRRWGPADRLLETGVLDVWREELNDPDLQNRPVRFEAELWYRDSVDKRAESESVVRGLVNSLQGQVITSGVIPGIRYHAVLAELPASRIQEIMDAPETELVKCDNIMFFRPVGQMTSGETPVDDYAEALPPRSEEFPGGAPVLAILDGMPYVSHQHLNGRIVLEDPDGWAEDYPASERVHGTTMASLAIHGDLGENSAALTRPVYMRPIMRPDARDFRRPRREVIPTDSLPVDLVHRSVKRMLEGEGEQPATAPSVKIVNLSIGDYSRAFMQSISPLARLLDWLSSKYGVLFIVSAGNQLEAVPLDMTLDELEQLSQSDLERKTITALLMNARSRSILSPAESINGITVGSIHFDACVDAGVANRFDPYSSALPSPVSSFGSGYRRSIKPDIVFPGGRQWYQKPYIGRQAVSLSVSGSMAPPGNKVAIPGQTASTDSTGYTRGTSNATALISRAAVHCYETLSGVIDATATAGYDDSYTAPLIWGFHAHLDT